MALCLNLNDVEDISAVYNALNKYGVCVDYDDEKQMKFKKRIIVGKVVHKYPVYHRNPVNMQDSDCFVIMLKKAYPKQCLSQEDRIFRFLALGDIIAYLVNIEVNTFMAIWNPKMFGTFNTSEPSFSVGPQNSVVWLIPKLTESAKFDEIVEVDIDCGLNSSSERGNSTIENKCTAGPSHSNRCCSLSAKEEINLLENCSKENCFQAILESQPPELSQNLSLSSVDLNSTEKRKTAVQKKLTEVSSQSKSCCLPAPNEKSTAVQNELTRKIPHCDCNVNKKRRHFCGKAEKCSNENSTFSVTSSSEEDSYSNIVCKNNPDFSYRNRCNCEHPERYRFKKNEAGTCCRPLQRNSTNNTDKRTCGYYHQLQKCPCCYSWNVKTHRRNEQILHTTSLKFNSNKKLMNSPNEISKSISCPQKQGALQNTSTTDINIKSFKKQCIQNRSYLNKSNIIEDVITTKVAKDKLENDKTVDWNSLDKVLASNNIAIKKKRKLFFADPDASDALIDVNSSIGKNKCNSIETKQYKVVQEIQETCNNDRIPPILPHKVFEENINKSEKDQKVTFDRSSTVSFLARNEISSCDTDSNSESDSDSHTKNLFHRRLLFKRRKRCKRRSRNSETSRSKDTSSTSSSEENLSHTDERSELRIVSVYTLSTDDELFLKKYCSLGKDISYPKLMDLTTKSHLSNFKRDSVHTIVKNNCDNKNTNCKMSKIEVMRIAEIKNTNIKATNNANRAGNSNNKTVLDDECLHQISNASSALIANANKGGNDKNTQTQSSVESSNWKMSNDAGGSSQLE